MTQPLGKNYGGIMQAWALQQVLKRMGHEPVTIDRQPNAKSVQYRIARLGYRVAMKVLGRRKAPINFERYYSDIYKHTDAFIKKHIVTSKKLDSTDKLKKYLSENPYDAIIIGSDQVWRPSYSPEIFNFYLDFMKKDKEITISYASSFGVDDWEYSKDQTEKCRELIRKFDAISVRELSGVALCKEKLNVNAKLVLDPTLLLNGSSYIEELNLTQNKLNNGKIFTYILDESDRKESLIKEIANKLKKEIFFSQPKIATTQDSIDINNYSYPPIEDWLASFCKADFIITDSFHGCVFSIIFNKPFLAISNNQRGASRFISLLKITNLEERLIREGQIINLETILNPIDWTEVNSIVEHYRNTSMAFLESVLPFK